MKKAISLTEQGHITIFYKEEPEKEAVRQYKAMYGILMLHIWKKGKKSLHIYRMSFEVQFAFLSREENVKLYMVMMSLEKIPIIHKEKCSHSVIRDIDMIM